MTSPDATDPPSPPLDRGAGDGPFPLIHPTDREALPAGVVDACPLAGRQSVTLFQSELRPETAVCQSVLSAWVRAPFDAPRLRAAIGRSAARHPALRTSFALSGFRQPLQLVHAEAEVPFAVDDLRKLPQTERERRVRAWLEAERQHGFLWHRAPLARFHAHRWSDDLFQLTLSFHHAVLDGRSAAALVTGLSRAYLELPEGEGEAPPPGVHLEAEAPLAAVDEVHQPAGDRRGGWKLPESAAPGGPLEETLAAVWREVLGVERLGRHDDLLALGGSSVVALQAVFRLRSIFDGDAVEIPLRWLLEAPTLAELAARVAGLLRAEPLRPSPPLDAHPAPAPSGELPLSFAQERLWFLEQLQPGTAAFHRTTVVRLTGALDATALGRCVDALVDRHESLRTRFPSLRDGDGPVQVIDQAVHHLGGGLPVVDVSGLPAACREAAAQAVAGTEALRPFALESGPLFRALLLRLGPHDHLALLAAHRMVADG